MKDSVGSRLQFFRPALILFKVILFVFILSSVCHADVLTLAWDPPSQDPDLVYTLCCGTDSQTYTYCVDAGNQTSITVDNIEPGIRYYYAVTASNQYGESEPSIEIEHTIPLVPNDSDGDGYFEETGDCNDNDAMIYPGAWEICGDGIDQDCNGSDMVCSESTENIDVDGDGITENEGDCNELDPAIYPGAEETCGDGIDQDCSGSDVVCIEEDNLVREAEEGIIDGAFEIINDSKASGGYYVQVPNGTGSRFDGPDDTHKLTFTFNVTANGEYRIKAIVYATTIGDDSFWVKVNGDPASGYLWDVLQNTNYQEDYVSDRDGSDPIEVFLRAGVNTVSVYLREDGTRLDSIELEPVVTIPSEIDVDGDGYFETGGDCDDMDSSINPDATEICGDSIDQDCSGSDVVCIEEDNLVREAEEGIIDGVFEIINDSKASGGYYVHAPNGTGTRYDGPDGTHKMTYRFNVSETGAYRIKAAVYAVTGSDDSFWIQVNDAPIDGYLWDVLQNTSYLEDYVSDRDGADPIEVSLSAGVNTVSVYLREDGTRLDRIELEPVDIVSPEIDPDGDGFTDIKGDCDDNDGSIYPGALETCGDGIDQDCDGSDLACVDANNDTDNDGLTDSEEVNIYHTDPNQTDTDGDGFSDGDEVANGSDPLSTDSNPDIESPKFEVGEVSVDHNWLFVSFSREYTDPVVVAGAASLNGSQPTTVRLRNVTSSGFEICLQEWEYLDGTHYKESVGYLVMERGAYRLSDGTMIEAGTFTTKTPPAFERVNFHAPFNRQPVVLSTVSSINDADAVVGRLRNVDSGGFNIKLQEQEANTDDHQGEVVSYLAWEPSVGSIDGFDYQVGLTGDVVTHEIHTIGFSVAFDQSPVFVCDMQTTDGGNTANLRWQTKDNFAVDVLVDEEQSDDEEINHITEVVGFIGIKETTK